MLRRHPANRWFRKLVEIAGIESKRIFFPTGMAMTGVAR